MPIDKAWQQSRQPTSTTVAVSGERESRTAIEHPQHGHSTANAAVSHINDTLRVAVVQALGVAGQQAARFLAFSQGQDPCKAKITSIMQYNDCML
jgi:2-methylcitrate dehydratase PrpD